MKLPSWLKSREDDQEQEHAKNAVKQRQEAIKARLKALGVEVEVAELGAPP